MLTLKRAIILASLVAVLILLVTAANAGCCSASHLDPDDTPGRLDLKRITYIKDGTQAPMRVTIRTYQSWRSRYLTLFSGNAVRVRLEVDDDPEADYVAAIRFRKGLVAVISGEGRIFDPIRVRRPDLRTARFRIPGQSPPNPNATDIGISAKTEFIASVTCDPASGGTLCVDLAPDWLTLASSL
jgi:hypothetical protein